MLSNINTETPNLVSPFAGGFPASADVRTHFVSSGGRWLAFTADATTEGALDLYVVDLRAAIPTAVSVTTLIAGRRVAEVVISPDEQTLAWIANSATPISDWYFSVFDLNTRTRVTGLSTQVPSETESPTRLSFSADSTQLAVIRYCSPIGCARTHTVLVFPRAGGAAATMPAVTGLDRPTTVTFAGSRYVAVTSTTYDDRREEVFVFDRTAGTAVAVQATRSTDTLTAQRGSVTVSSDGTAFAFLGDLTFNGAPAAYYVDLRTPPTAGSARLAHDAFASAAQDITSLMWSPVDRQLAMRGDFFGDANEEIFLADLRTATRITRNLLSASQPAFADIDTLRWAPDGTGIAFVGDLSTDGIDELHYASLATGTRVRLNTPMAMGDEVRSFRFFSGTGLFATIRLSGQIAAHQLAVSAPESMTRVSPTVIAGATGVTGSLFSFPGDERCAVSGQTRTARNEAFLLDPITGTSRWLHPAVSDLVFSFSTLR